MKVVAPPAVLLSKLRNDVSPEFCFFLGGRLQDWSHKDEVCPAFSGRQSSFSMSTSTAFSVDPVDLLLSPQFAYSFQASFLSKPDTVVFSARKWGWFLPRCGPRDPPLRLDRHVPPPSTSVYLSKRRIHLFF